MNKKKNRAKSLPKLFIPKPVESPQCIRLREIINERFVDSNYPTIKRKICTPISVKIITSGKTAFQYYEIKSK